MAGRSVRVQVVLYGGERARLFRFAGAVGATAHRAKGDGRAGTVELALGDSSPEPVLDPEEVETLSGRGVEAGLDRLTYDFFGANLGHAGGNNRLAGVATADFLLLLNPDTYPTPRLLGELLDVAADQTIGVVEARQLPFEHPKAFDLVTGETSWASGSCLLVRREAYEAIGGFDAEHFFLYCDDVDLSWRVRLAGLRVVHAPRAAVFHDKRLDANGKVIPAELENEYGVLGRLMLAHRYGRPGIADQTVATIERGGSDAERRALPEYRRRREEGRLPEPVPGAERVAEFVGADYARHRF